MAKIRELTLLSDIINRNLMQAILYDKIKIADAVRVQIISLEQGPKGYMDLDGGAAKKYVIDPHGRIPA